MNCSHKAFFENEPFSCYKLDIRRKKFYLDYLNQKAANKIDVNRLMRLVRPALHLHLNLKRGDSLWNNSFNTFTIYRRISVNYVPLKSKNFISSQEWNKETSWHETLNKLRKKTLLTKLNFWCFRSFNNF